MLESGVFSFFSSHNVFTNGINNDEMISGSYQTATSVAGFVWLNGRRLSLMFPGAPGTAAYGISNSGQVAGVVYTGVSGASHGFVTSPTTVADSR